MADALGLTRVGGEHGQPLGPGEAGPMALRTFANARVRAAETPAHLGGDVEVEPPADDTSFAAYLRATGAVGAAGGLTAGPAPCSGPVSGPVSGVVSGGPAGQMALPELRGIGSPREQLRWTAVQAESMLLQEVLNSAFPHGLSAGLVGQGLGSRFYDSLLLAEWARTWAESGGIGLADALVDELAPQLGVEPSAVGRPSPPPQSTGE